MSSRPNKRRASTSKPKSVVLRRQTGLYPVTALGHRPVSIAQPIPAQAPPVTFVSRASTITEGPSVKITNPLFTKYQSRGPHTS